MWEGGVLMSILHLSFGFLLDIVSEKSLLQLESARSAVDTLYNDLNDVVLLNGCTATS